MPHRWAASINALLQSPPSALRLPHEPAGAHARQVAGAPVCQAEGLATRLRVLRSGSSVIILYDNKTFAEGTMSQMDPAVQQVLDEYEVRSVAEETRWHELEWNNFVVERDQFLLAVGPATGQLMNLLVKETESRVILEIGTSYGYSTLWLAEAARQTGGRVITLELHAEKQQYAREKMTRAGLADVIE